MRHAYGRSALLLSGGAILSLYHFGLVKMLILEGIMPRIVTGSSAGSIIASFVCTRRYEDHLKDLDFTKINFDVLE